MRSLVAGCIVVIIFGLGRMPATELFADEVPGGPSAQTGERTIGLSPSDQELENSLDSILDAPEFHHLQRGEAAPHENDESDESASRDADDSSYSRAPSTNLGFDLGGLGVFFTYFFWAIVVVAVIAILIAVVLAMRSNANAQVSSIDENPVNVLNAIVPEVAPGETDADVYVAKARKLAAAGRYREAIAHLLLGAMSRTEREKLLQFRQGLTLRDYLRALRPHPHMYQGLRQMVRIYEPLGFGRRTATESHFNESLESYVAAFGKTTANQA